MITKFVGKYKATLALYKERLNISIIQQEESMEFFTSLQPKDIPPILGYIVESIPELFEVLADIEQEGITIKDSRITFIITLLHKKKQVSFDLQKRSLKDEAKICLTCINCQKMKEKTDHLIMEMEKFKQMKEAEVCWLTQKIKYLEEDIARKDQFISKVQTEAIKSLNQQLYKPSLLLTTLPLTFTASPFFIHSNSILRLSEEGKQLKSHQAISDEPIPPTGKHTIIVKYLSKSKSIKDSSICVGLLTRERFKAKSNGGKGDKFSVGFWNMKDDSPTYFGPVYQDIQGDINGEIWVDGEIVVRSKKLFVNVGEWIRLDIDIQAQEVEFITRLGSIATRKFPINYKGKEFHLFVRMADSDDVIEFL